MQNHQSPTANRAEQMAAMFDAAQARQAARHTIGTTAALGEYAFCPMTRQAHTVNGTVVEHMQEALARVTAQRCSEGYRNLPVSFRELRKEARGYRDGGYSHRDACRLALDTAAPYHELFRSH